jgi:hypothetical protein
MLIASDSDSALYSPCFRVSESFPALGLEAAIWSLDPDLRVTSELLSLPHWQWGFRAAKNLNFKPSHVL